MNYLPKALLLYSTIVCTALFTVGIVTSRSDSSFLSQMILLPVVGYLIYKSSKIRAYQINSKGLVFYVPILGLVFLSFISVNNIASSTQNIETNNNLNQVQNITIINKNTDKVDLGADLSQYIHVQLDSPSEYVNIKKDPSVQSLTIGQGLPGERFEVIEMIDDWYKVNTIYGEGYINKDFVEK